MQTEVAGIWERVSPDRVKPSALGADGRQRLGPVLDLLGKLRRRRWQQIALQRAVDMLLLLAPIAAVLVLAVRSAWIGVALDLPLFGALGVVAVALLVWTVGHRTRWFEAARLADDRSGGKDRMSTAFELAAAGRDDSWVAVQAHDAVRWAESVDHVTVLPWAAPQRWPTVVAALLAAVLSVVAPLPWTAPPIHILTVSNMAPSLPGALPHMSPVVDLLDENQIELLTADVEVLRDIEEQVEPGPTRDWIRKVRRNLEDVVSGKLDKRAALEALAKLDKERPTPSPSNNALPSAAAERNNEPNTRSPSPNPNKPSPKSANSSQKSISKGDSSRAEASRDKAVRSSIAKALEESLKHAPKSTEQQKLKEAAENKDLDAISKWVEKMAQKEWTDKQLEKWIKVAEKFADKLGDKKLDSKFDKLRKQVNRLQRKRERQGGLNSADRRRLRSKRRNLQSLDRKHGDVKAARHQLQRLQRNTKKAAQQMRRRQKSRLGRRPKTPQAKKEARRERQQRRRAFQRSMSRASEQMRRMSQQQKQRQARRIGESRVQQAREAIGRAGRRSQSRKDFEKRARQKQAGEQGSKQGKRSKSAQSRSGRMKKAQGASREKSQQRAKQRAKQRGQAKAGAQGKGRRGGRSKFRLGGADMPDDPRMRMMRDGGSRPQLSQMKRGGGEAPGKGVGADPNGPRSKRLGVGRTERIKGIQNDGPTVKQTFIEAAKKGFAKTSWGAVYKDYSEVAESMIDRQGLPVGRKALVRRYFELIRPRNKVEKK